MNDLDNAVNDYVELSLINSNIQYTNKHKKDRVSKHKILNIISTILKVNIYFLWKLIKLIVIIFVLIFTFMFALVKE